MDHFADRLFEAVKEKGSPVCVGIDPVLERLPLSLQKGDAVDGITQFTQGVLHAVAEHVPCVKFQSACFERYHWRGVEAYHRLIHEAKQLGLIVIADAKRGDIGISAAHYAAGCLSDIDLGDGETLLGPDALTINSYLGGDSIEPFIEVAASQGKGLFVLVRTSNPGGDQLQALALAEGGQVVDQVAGMVAKLGESHLGEGGLSLLGSVVGATKVADAARLRAMMPQQIFLVPGFGAQGGSADDVKVCFCADGTGAIITASRSVLYPFDPADENWTQAVAAAALDLNQQIATVLG